MYNLTLSTTFNLRAKVKGVNLDIHVHLQSV